MSANLSLSHFYNETMPPPTKKRKSEAAKIEEISFDPAARSDYLTGFHKRKLQRAKYARDLAEKKAREEKIEERRRVWWLSNLLPIF